MNIYFITDIESKEQYKIQSSDVGYSYRFTHLDPIDNRLGGIL